MSNDSAKAQEIHATVTGPGQPEQAAPVRTVPASVVEPDDVMDADDAGVDAVIIEEVPAGSARSDLRPADAATSVPASAAPVAARPDVPASASAGGARPGVPAGTHPDVRASTDTADDAAHLHDRWTAIQSTFVDDPRGSVVAAAELVTEAVDTLVSAAKERERGLRTEWDHDGVDTEDLRNTLRNYRGFLDHLATL